MSLKNVSEPLEWHELKQLFFSQLLKNRETGGSDFDVQVDYENQPIFYAKGYVNIGYDEHGNYQVIDISIGEAGFQWPDFEAELPNKYINQLEIFCKE